MKINLIDIREITISRLTDKSAVIDRRSRNFSANCEALYGYPSLFNIRDLFDSPRMATLDKHARNKNEYFLATHRCNSKGGKIFPNGNISRAPRQLTMVVARISLIFTWIRLGRESARAN